MKNSNPSARVLRCLAVGLFGLSLTACEPIALEGGQRILNYEEARGIFWSQLYAGGGQTLYCEQEFEPNNRQGLNVEHVFPMSWVTNALDCGTRTQCRERSQTFNRIEADLHNLYPSRTNINSARASFRFGEVRGERRNYGRSCDFEVNRRARVAEPPPKSRGEVARAMFYMAHQYREQGLTIFARSGKLLQQWHNEDPPSVAERQRNERIEQLQGNRNIFVDSPDQLNELIAEGYFY